MRPTTGASATAHSTRTNPELDSRPFATMVSLWFAATPNRNNTFTGKSFPIRTSIHVSSKECHSNTNMLFFFFFNDNLGRAIIGHIHQPFTTFIQSMKGDSRLANPTCDLNTNNLTFVCKNINIYISS